MSTLRNGRITQLVILQWLAALPANSVDTLVQLRYKIEFRGPTVHYFFKDDHVVRAE